MSRFYASIEGNRGRATRQETPNSGIQGHIRGWHVGAKVFCYVDPETGKDVVQVYSSGGSNGSSRDILITEFGENDLAPKFFK